MVFLPALIGGPRDTYIPDRRNVERLTPVLV